MNPIKNFTEKTLGQIRLWTWAAAILPFTALAGVFFVWLFGTQSWFDIFIVVVSTAVFSCIVFWWWWITWVLSKNIKNNLNIQNDIDLTLKTISDLKQLLEPLINKNNK